MNAATLDLIWAAILALTVFAYVVMDGFDLGIGMLSPLFESGAERDDAVNSIAPFWDGNETWLVLGGGGLLAAFPVAYSIILPATYPLIIAMLIGLIFRGCGVRIQMAQRASPPILGRGIFSGLGHCRGCPRSRSRCSRSGHKGSQQCIRWRLAGLADPVHRPLWCCTCLGVLPFGRDMARLEDTRVYAGAARAICVPIAIATLGGIVIVSAATPFLHNQYWHRWLETPGVLYAAQVPLLVLIFASILFVSLKRRSETLPFMMALALFLVTCAGLGVSVFPYLVPTQVTLWQAAAPVQSLEFMLDGTVVILPLIIAYKRMGTLGFSRQSRPARLPGVKLMRPMRVRLGWMAAIWGLSVGCPAPLEHRHPLLPKALSPPFGYFRAVRQALIVATLPPNWRVLR